MSQYAPPSNNGDPVTKFAEFEVYAEGKTGSNGNSYFAFTVEVLPFDLSKQPHKKKEFSFGETYRKVMWPSIELMAKSGYVKSPDDLITAVGETPKRFYASYQTPMHLTPASAKDIEWAKANDRLGDFEVDTIGRAMRKNYPIKFIKVYPTKEAYEADANQVQVAAPAPVQPATPNPEYQAVLAMLPIFVNNSGLDLRKLELSLSNPPLSTYFTVNSPEVKLEVAKAVIAKTGPTDDNAIKGVLIGLNGGGYLDITSPEIVSMRESVVF